jgi:hypothetical protein
VSGRAEPDRAAPRAHGFSSPLLRPPAARAKSGQTWLIYIYIYI